MYTTRRLIVGVFISVFSISSAAFAGVANREALPSLAEQQSQPEFDQALPNSNPDFELADGHSIVTDRESGRSVLLENQDGFTIVTDTETGESITVRGMLAGSLSDDGYTEMMKASESSIDFKP